MTNWILVTTTLAPYVPDSTTVVEQFTTKDEAHTEMKNQVLVELEKRIDIWSSAIPNVKCSTRMDLINKKCYDDDSYKNVLQITYTSAKVEYYDAHSREYFSGVRWMIVET